MVVLEGSMVRALERIVVCLVLLMWASQGKEQTGELGNSIGELLLVE
jgi:hypothetical protein